MEGCRDEDEHLKIWGRSTLLGNGGLQPLYWKKPSHKAQLLINQFVYNSAHKVMDTNVWNEVPPGPSLRDKMRCVWTELKVEVLLLDV